MGYFITTDTISIKRMIPYFVLQYYSGFFDSIVTAMTLPIIQQELNMNNQAALTQWLQTITIISKAAFAIPLANLGVRCGLKLAMNISLIVLSIADISMLFVNQFWQILLVRLISGIAQCSIIQCSQVYVQNLLPDASRKDFMRVQNLIFNLIGATGPFIAGIIIDQLNWRWNYIIISVIAFIRIIFISFCMDKVVIKSQKFDIIGSLSLICSLIFICVSFTVLAYQKYVFFAVLLILGICSFVAFIEIEKQVNTPLIDIQFIIQPIQSISCIVSSLFMITSMESVLLPQFMHHIFSNISYLGYINSSKGILVFFSQLTTQILLKYKKVTPILLLIIGGIISVCCFVLISSTTKFIWVFIVFYILRAVFSSPIAMTIQPLMIMMVPREKVHHVTSLNSTAATMFSCVGTSIITMILQLSNSMLKEDKYYLSIAICYSFITIVMFAVLGQIIYLMKTYKTKIHQMENNHIPNKEDQIENKSSLISSISQDKTQIESEK